MRKTQTNKKLKPFDTSVNEGLFDPKMKKNEIRRVNRRGMDSADRANRAGDGFKVPSHSKQLMKRSELKNPLPL